MDIVLSPAVEEYVQTQVTSGRYRSAEEAIAEGVRLLKVLSSDHPEIRPLYEAYLI